MRVHAAHLWGWGRRVRTRFRRRPRRPRTPGLTAPARTTAAAAAASAARVSLHPVAPTRRSRAPRAEVPLPRSRRTNMTVALRRSSALCVSTTTAKKKKFPGWWKVNTKRLLVTAARFTMSAALRASRKCCGAGRRTVLSRSLAHSLPQTKLHWDEFLPLSFSLMAQVTGARGHFRHAPTQEVCTCLLVLLLVLLLLHCYYTYRSTANTKVLHVQLFLFDH